MAVFEGHLEIIKLLLTAGADINIQCEYYERTALHLAVSRRHLKIMKALLKAEADFDIQITADKQHHIWRFKKDILRL